MTEENLKEMIRKLNIKLEKLETQLHRLTPMKPIALNEINSSRTLYYCSYCGERVRKNAWKHKCGQAQDWKEIK